MERIKSNIKKHDTDKKERVKRENRKKIDADQAKTKSDTYVLVRSYELLHAKDMLTHFV